MKNVLKLSFQLTETKIVFCYGNKSYSKYMDKIHNLSESIHHSGVTTHLNANGKMELVIGINKSDNIYGLKGLTVHELSHAVGFIMKEFNFDCDEFRSYTIQWLYSEIIPFLDEILLKGTEYEPTKR